MAQVPWEWGCCTAHDAKVPEECPWCALEKLYAASSSAPATTQLGTCGKHSVTHDGDKPHAQIPTGYNECVRWKPASRPAPAECDCEGLCVCSANPAHRAPAASAASLRYTERTLEGADPEAAPAPATGAVTMREVVEALRNYVEAREVFLTAPDDDDGPEVDAAHAAARALLTRLEKEEHRG